MAVLSCAVWRTWSLHRALEVTFSSILRGSGSAMFSRISRKWLPERSQWFGLGVGWHRAVAPRERKKVCVTNHPINVPSIRICRHLTEVFKCKRVTFLQMLRTLSKHTLHKQYLYIVFSLGQHTYTHTYTKVMFTIIYYYILCLLLKYYVYSQDSQKVNYYDRAFIYIKVIVTSEIPSEMLPELTVILITNAIALLLPWSHL